MKPQPTPNATPIAAPAPDPAGEAQKRAIADALWTEIHWLMPRNRTVTITVIGDRITVELGPPDPARRPSSH